MNSSPRRCSSWGDIKVPEASPKSGSARFGDGSAAWAGIRMFILRQRQQRLRLII
jgi:hypothetical protein